MRRWFFSVFCGILGIIATEVGWSKFVWGSPASTRPVLPTSTQSRPSLTQQLHPINQQAKQAQQQWQQSRLDLAQRAMVQAETLWRSWVQRYGTISNLTQQESQHLRQRMDRIQQQIQQSIQQKQAFLQRRCPQSSEHFPDEDQELRLSVNLLLSALKQHSLFVQQTAMSLQQWRTVSPIQQRYLRQQRHNQETAHVEACVRTLQRQRGQRQIQSVSCYRVQAVFTRNSVAAHWSLWKLSRVRDILAVPCRLTP